MNRVSIIIIILLILSILTGVAEFYLNSKGIFEADRIQSAWGLVFLILTIMWAIDDSKKQDFERPFDFGFLMYIFWPLAFPYYLLATRKVEGFTHIVGFYGLWVAPWFAGLVAYIYVYE